MKINEAQNILLLYRPGTADAADPQIAEALALAQREPELARWLEEHCVFQESLRAKFRQIPVPAGLKEQIVSEQSARDRITARHPRLTVAALLLVIALCAFAVFWQQWRPQAEALAVCRNHMMGIATSGYGMELLTTNQAEIRSYLAKRHAAADYVLPAALAKATLVGCAVQDWQKQKVSMLCFRTGRPLPPHQTTDLWLFVVPQASIKDAPESGEREVITINGLVTAVWTQGDKVYLLGTTGNEAAIQQFL